jgi:hypothetical protein
MIDGLKLAMSGDEVISLLDERIECLRAVIGIKWDAIAGSGPPPRTECVCQVPAEVVEEEIRQHEHRVRVLTIIREHVLRRETYLIGKDDLEFGCLLPDPPPASLEAEFSEQIRWVTHPVDVTAALHAADRRSALRLVGGSDDRRTGVGDGRPRTPEPVG